jgi:hypothetical protein
MLTDKKSLRARLRRLRREHVNALPASMSALLFMRPPGAVAALAGEGTTIGLYHAISGEAPTRAMPNGLPKMAGGSPFLVCGRRCADAVSGMARPV